MSNQTIDSEASDVNNANANHISATTALKTHDKEMQKIFSNCEELSEILLYYGLWAFIRAGKISVYITK